LRNNPTATLWKRLGSRKQESESFGRLTWSKPRGMIMLSGRIFVLVLRKTWNA
jgi:hypothetical protein